MESALKSLHEYGISAVVILVLFFLINPKLEKILSVLFDLGLAITLLVASLPEIKKRTREEAERLKGKFDAK